MKALKIAALTTLTLLTIPVANADLSSDNPDDWTFEDIAEMSSEDLTEFLMEMTSEDIEELGLTQSNADITGDLGDMDYTTHTRYFVEGKPYMVSAVCDEDCDDIDITIYDKYDNEVAADEDDSDYALTGFVPDYSGNYKIEVWMYECDASYCYYRVRTFD